MDKIHQGYLKVTDYLRKHGIESDIIDNEYILARDSEDVTIVIENMREAIEMVRQKGKL